MLETLSIFLCVGLEALNISFVYCKFLVFLARRVLLSISLMGDGFRCLGSLGKCQFMELTAEKIILKLLFGVWKDTKLS